MSKTATVNRRLAATIAALTLSACNSGIAAQAVPRETSPVPVAAAPAIPWSSSGNPYVFTVSDSIIAGCTLDHRDGGTLGIGWRDLGHDSWSGSTSTQQRNRIQGVGSWPDSSMTEDTPGGPNTMEQTWFRDAGALVIMLGTNDASKSDVDTYRDNVRWFVERDPSRPVVWVNSSDLANETRIGQFNAVLDEEAKSHPNMKVVNWHGFIANGHGWDVRGDGVHLADGDGCQDLFGLISRAVPGVPSDDAPRGWWYGSSPYGGGVVVNGWASAWTDPRRQAPRVTVRVDWQQVAQEVPAATDAGADDWANAASGRSWGVVFPASDYPRVVCVDLWDDKGQWTPLGCRWVNP